MFSKFIVLVVFGRETYLTKGWILGKYNFKRFCKNEIFTGGLNEIQNLKNIKSNKI